MRDMFRPLRRGTTLVALRTRTPTLRARCRLYSNEVRQGQRSLPHRSATPDEPAHQYYSESLQHALTIVGRFFKFAAIGGVGVGLAVVVAWEGAHQWVEYHELAPLPQNLPDPFEWGKELERWTAPEGKGGTDPRLGWNGRHVVRAAWISLNWALGTDASIIQASRPGADSIALNDSALVKAVIYLDSALAIAHRKPEMARDDGTMDQTVLDLNTLRASVLARIGSPEALKSASSIYLQVHDALLREGRSSDAARMAVKLGDISARLNESDTAIRWWKSAMELMGVPESMYTEIGTASKDAMSSESTSLPHSPYSQRTLMSALVSLSAHFATSHKFREALALENARFTISHQLVRQTSALSSPMPTHVEKSVLLHSLFLDHRTTLLHIHAGEVLYALDGRSPSSDASPESKSPPFFQRLTSKSSSPSTSPVKPSTIPVSLASLKFAVSCAESIIRALTQESSAAHRIPPPLSATFHLAPPTSVTTLSPTFASSPLLGAPAEVLLRQAKRTATHALNLTGMVLEEQGDVDEALDHFERALDWAGGRDDHDERHAIQSEWKSVWMNYVRVREAVLSRGSGEKKP